MTSQTPGGLNTILGSHLTILVVIRSVPFPPCQVMLSFACSILAYSRKTLHLYISQVRALLGMRSMLLGCNPCAFYSGLGYDHQ